MDPKPSCNNQKNYLRMEYNIMVSFLYNGMLLCMRITKWTKRIGNKILVTFYIHMNCIFFQIELGVKHTHKKVWYRNFIIA